MSILLKHYIDSFIFIATVRPLSINGRISTMFSLPLPTLLLGSLALFFTASPSHAAHRFCGFLGVDPAGIDPSVSKPKRFSALERALELQGFDRKKGVTDYFEIMNGSVSVIVINTANTGIDGVRLLEDLNGLLGNPIIDLSLEGSTQGLNLVDYHFQPFNSAFKHQDRLVPAIFATGGAALSIFLGLDIGLLTPDCGMDCVLTALRLTIATTVGLQIGAVVGAVVKRLELGYEYNDTETFKRIVVDHLDQLDPETVPETVFLIL
jgi:hypothetical protein